MKYTQRKIKAGRRILGEIADGIRGFYRIPERELEIRTTRNGNNEYNHEAFLDGKPTQSFHETDVVRMYQCMHQRMLSLDPNLEKTATSHTIPSRLRF